MSIEDGPGDTLDQSESLDSDEIRGTDDVDDVVTPPDSWTEADKFGTTEREAREGESLDQKLAEEVPDVPLEEELDVPVAATPDDDLTEELVDRIIDSDDENDYIADATEDDGTDGAAVKDADVVDGVVVENSATHRGQIDGTPEDAGSYFD
ncbi:hypothetical protein HQ312_07145 [Rhodococcus sp. BP-316]|uniref:hypothetical protein n=1 Tax=unclassified Rhodococcus (in: high G+C Gram-positive bacteria) TaxID=192944 RepID=UPI001C9B9127|nr:MULTISPECIES: hypothetical protein [unclassified Rhodococcus (in: high G+C Gram-positive bacteria)]MBY6680829.1 hypothetical protein [Rhodococcus sp. BP-316]MDQ1202408.1 hypothetical protein [Rhodococcus sp. SORGH_AS_0303]